MRRILCCHQLPLKHPQCFSQMMGHVPKTYGLKISLVLVYVVWVMGDDERMLSCWFIIALLK
jgi:hypothetical protein